MSFILPLFIAVPLAGAFLTMPHARLHRRLADVLCMVVMGSMFLATILIFFIEPAGKTMVYYIGGFQPPVGITLVVDGLSRLFLLIINSIALVIGIYSIPYMERYTNKEFYCTLLLLMIAGMNGAVMTGDLINLFVFLELASISSAALVAFGTESEELEASFKYLMIGSVASMLILFAIALLLGMTGTTSMAGVSRALPFIRTSAKAFISMLLLVGFCTKSAIFPFHAWLPDAHPSAPAPISAMLSGVLIKALGIYSITRIFYNVFGMTHQVSFILVTLGALSILVGSFLALGQWDMKRLLACSSISQVGYIIIGIGLATPMGVMGGLLHLFNHSIIKPLLFLNAGSVEYSTGTRDMKELGGLGQKMPVTGMTSMIGSLSISGVPPFNGFWSKLMIIIACIQAGSFILAFVAVLGSILTLGYFLRLQKESFFGNIPAKLKRIHRTPFAMGLSMAVLAVCCFVCGIFFQYVIKFLINPAVLSVAGGTAYNRIIGGL